jgi:hypothetical protein
MADQVRDPVRYYFAQGDRFLLLSAYLWRQDGQEIYNACLNALTVCEAFGAEAFLKSLIRLESGKDAPSKHNLKTLFELLQPNTRKAIRKEWLQRHAAGVLNIDHGPGFKKVKTFEEALDLSAHTFIKFRYNLTEHIGWHMRALGYLVRREILKHRPEWKPPAASPFSLIDPHPSFVNPEPKQASEPPVGSSILNYKTPAFKVQIRNSTDPKDDRAR